MGFPSGVPTVLVTAPANGYRTLDGEFQKGTITLTPTVPEVVSAEHGIIAVGAVNLTLAASGSFTPRAVLPTDADGFTPTGWTYRLDQDLTGETPRSYNITIPASAGSVDLSQLVEVDTSGGEIVYAPAVLSGPAGGDLSGSYPDPTVARINGVTLTGTPDVGQVPTATSATEATWQTPTGGGGGSGTPSGTVVAETAYGQSSAAGSSSTYARGDHSHGTPPLPTTGTTAGTYAAGDDPRLSDARTPTAHASSHATGGTDAMTPGSIGAATASDLTSLSGTVSTVDGFVNDCLARVSAIEQGTAFLAGGHFTAPVDISSTGLAAVRFVGRLGTSGAPASGTFSAGDTVQDAAGAWWLCTAGGTPGTWQTSQPAGAAGGDLGGSYPSPTVTATHLAAPLPVAQGGTGAASASAALAAYAAVQGRNPLTGSWLPSAYGAAGDYATDDTAAVQAAIDACSAAGGGDVLLGQHVFSGSGIHPKTGVRLRGVPGYSKIKNSANNTAISSSVACTDITFEGFTIEGPVTEVPSVPKRTRTSSGNGTTFGIWLDGDLDPTASGAPAITNVTIRNVTVKNVTELPVRLFGIRGRCVTESCFFFNCKDAGWGYCEAVECLDNHSLKSADNGLSLSRGNLAVTCTGNTVRLAAYHGIWLSGFLGSTGPSDFSCAGNTVQSVGQCGILLQDAPKYGVVTGNLIDKQWIRGDSTAVTDEYVYGIMIRGNSSTPDTPGTSVAYGLRVADNVIYAAPRAGISIDGATACVVEDNLIQDAGSQYMADGTTAIPSSSTSQNIGILCSYPATLTACVIRNNTITDSRATPYTNRGVYPVRISGALVYGNTLQGGRNATVLPAVLDAWNDGRVDDGQETIPRWAANNSSSITMSSGVLRLSYFVARRTSTVTAIRVNSGSTAAGATPTLVRAGLYSVDSSGNLTLMSAVTSDTSLLAAALTTYQRNLAAAQTVLAGQRYAIGLIVVTGATSPTVTGCLAATAGENSLSPALCATLTGQTDLPSSMTAGSLGITQSLMYAVAVGA